MKKICSKCKQEKELADFVKDSRGKDGFRSYCKICFNAIHREYQKEYWAKNRDKCRRRLRIYRAKNREKVLKWSRLYYARSRSKFREGCRLWYLKNREKRLAVLRKNRIKNRDILNKNARLKYARDKDKINDKRNIRLKKIRDNLENSYIKDLIKKDSALNSSDISKAFIELYRLNLILKRLTRRKQNVRCENRQYQDSK